MSESQKRPIFYDTETTGIRAENDRIIELAAYDPVREKTFEMLINPERPIPLEASAIHHITDEMVKDAPKFAEVAHKWMEFLDGDVVLIAHNNDAFDKHFLRCEFERTDIPLPDWNYLDSLKWARKYRYDLPRHALQFLREVYDVEANQAHRALDDVMVLYKVFMKMTDGLPIDTVVELMQQKTNTNRMPFGKHQGKELKDVPKSYASWLEKSGAFERPENQDLKNQFVELGILS